jgi:hypothetical protein
MIHEHIEDSRILVAALQSGHEHEHEHVPQLSRATDKLCQEFEARDWLVPAT